MFELMLWIFYLRIIENPTQKYVLYTPLVLFSHFASIINFEASTFIQSFFQTWKYFHTLPALIKALEFPRYLLYIFIWVYFSVLEVSLSRLLNMLLCISLKFSFLCVLPLYRFLSFDLILDGLG